MAAASIQNGDLIVRVRVRGELGRGEGGCVCKHERCHWTVDIGYDDDGDRERGPRQLTKSTINLLEWNPVPVIRLSAAAQKACRRSLATILDLSCIVRAAAMTYSDVPVGFRLPSGVLGGGRTASGGGGSGSLARAAPLFAGRRCK